MPAREQSDPAEFAAETLSATSASGDASRSATTLDRGAILGRYVVLDVLGSGAMGIVYSAYDPELDRKIALKLLRRDPAGDTASRSTEGRTRLLGEAQALAKLDHPNVVTVHDVGTANDRVWLAMEFVDGQTLGRWLRAESRAWPQVLAVMRRAALGLAAAHAAGLLHGDFKPDNVMIGSDDRVRVMDFGLARKRAVDPAAEADGLSGTPAYMSREQFERQPADPRSDQYSYCVTLWEALFGERPFAGTTLPELAAAVVDGNVRAPPPGRRVPQWLRRICQRGMATDRARRFASMDALLAALDRGQARAKLRSIAAGLAAVTVLGAGAIGWQRFAEHRRIAACEAEGAVIFDVWNDEAGARVRSGVLASKMSYAEVTANKLIPWLDAYSTAWREHRTQACTLASGDGSWDAEVLDRSTWCLDERRIELAALVTRLGAADATLVQRAVHVAAQLPPISPCIDEAQLRRNPPPPPTATRAAIAEVRTELARAGTLSEAAGYAEGLAVVRAAAAQATALDWPPLHAAARLRESILLARAGDYAEAERVAVTAYMDGARANAWDVAADAATGLVEIIGYRQSRHAEAETWAGHAEIAALLAGDPLGPRTAGRLGNLGLVREAAGDYTGAAALHERALAIKLEALGPGHPSVARSLNNLANAHKEAGDLAEARRLLEQAIALWEDALGPAHPDVAVGLVNLGTVHRTMGATDEAQAMFERALVIQESSLGARHPQLAATLNNLGNLDKDMDRYEAAGARYERSIAILEAANDPGNPQIALGLSNLASVRTWSGKHAEAEALLVRALDIRERALGRDHVLVAWTLVDLATSYLAQKRPTEAVSRLERAIAIYDARDGAEAREPRARELLAEARAAARNP